MNAGLNKHFRTVYKLELERQQEDKATRTSDQLLFAIGSYRQKYNGYNLYQLGTNHIWSTFKQNKEFIIERRYNTLILEYYFLGQSLATTNEEQLTERTAWEDEKVARFLYDYFGEEYQAIDYLINLKVETLMDLDLKSMKRILKAKQEAPPRTPNLEAYLDPFEDLLGQKDDGAGELWKPEVEQVNIEDVPLPPPRQTAKRSGRKHPPVSFPVVPEDEINITLDTDEELMFDELPPGVPRLFTPPPQIKPTPTKRPLSPSPGPPPPSRITLDEYRKRKIVFKEHDGKQSRPRVSKD
jgi:hypothetical protein